jgi:predicted Na+-dependent transporter
MKRTQQIFRPFNMGIAIRNMSPNVSYWIEFISENRNMFDILAITMIV